MVVGKYKRASTKKVSWLHKNQKYLPKGGETNKIRFYPLSNL